MAKFICVKELPFNFANDVYYQHFVLTLNPAAKKVSGIRVRRDIAKLVGGYKLNLIKTFANLKNKVSLCVDIWNDHWERFHYMSITCQWIDDSWKIQKRLIAFQAFDVEPNETNISNQINIVLNEYGLVQKIFSVSFDNASVNTTSLLSLNQTCHPLLGGKFFYVRCICHMINLFAQDAITVLNDEVSPIRNVVHFLARHEDVSKKWVRFCKQNDMKAKRFPQDVPDRWNSTYTILNESYEYKEELCVFFSSIDYSVPLVPSQWDACTNLCQILRVFNDTIVNLSKVYHPTSFLVLDHCILVATTFHRFTDCPILGDCIANMKHKWLKYFKEIPMIFLVAKLLDPRVRMNGLEELLTCYYQNLFSNNMDLDESVYINIYKCMCINNKYKCMRVFEKLDVDN